MTPKVDQVIDLAAIPVAVRNAGFTPGEMRLVATGTFSGVPPHARFQIRGWPTDLTVRSQAALPTGEQRIFARVDYAESPVLWLESPGEKP